MANNQIIIVGAGPAGLAAGYELAKKGQKVVVLEKDNIAGGISRTVCHNDFRFDIGGHRFFTKIERVNELWREVLGDEFLRRPRLSRIYYNNRFFNYPLKPTNALMGLGIFTSMSILASYVASKIKPYPSEDTFEQWVCNRFGKKLYRIFFKTYTEKVWGIPCDQIEAEWAAQRIKGLSLMSAVKAALIGDKGNKIKTLIEEFDYPRYGPGQMYEKMAEDIRGMGGEVLFETVADSFEFNDGKAATVRVVDKNGQARWLEAENIVVSLPLTEFVKKVGGDKPKEVVEAADSLKYRSLLTVNLMMDRPESFPDTWIYVHSPDVKVGRVQCFKNWSPYMVPNEKVSSLGLEYFCTEGDELWNAKDKDLVELGKKEIDQLGLADSGMVFDAFIVRCPKTYPVYSRNYNNHVKVLKDFAGQFDSVQCVGRNGMFKYNNMDHSILSGLLAADNILGGDNDLWAINTEEEYHEQAQTEQGSQD